MGQLPLHQLLGFNFDLVEVERLVSGGAGHHYGPSVGPPRRSDEPRSRRRRQHANIVGTDAGEHDFRFRAKPLSFDGD